MSLASAIRTARTATTAAQNAGRMDSYHAAKGMGIKLKKEWLATLDGRTRHAHAILFWMSKRQKQTSPSTLMATRLCTLGAQAPRGIWYITAAVL